jgi:hypothetical protein
MDRTSVVWRTLDRSVVEIVGPVFKESTKPFIAKAL